MTDISIFQQMHTALARELLRKIQSGEATAAELNVAAKFLKDNGIDCYGQENPETASLAESMNFPVDDDDDEVVVSLRRS